VLISLDETNGDQCVWYLVNLLFDTTIGVLLCYLLVLILNELVKRNNWKILEKGLYYEEYKDKNGKTKTRLLYKMYFAQLCTWIVIVMIVNIT